jgi:excisionase family DNA binding protein
MSKEVRLVHNVRNRSLSEGCDMAMKGGDNSEKLLTPSEVAALFRVDPKTVTRWAKAGKLSSIRTLGGHRRYRESEIRELIEVSSQE